MKLNIGNYTVEIKAINNITRETETADFLARLYNMFYDTADAYEHEELNILAKRTRKEASDIYSKLVSIGYIRKRKTAEPF